MNLDAITAAVGGLAEYGGRVCVASNLTAALESFKPFKATLKSWPKKSSGPTNNWRG